MQRQDGSSVPGAVKRDISGMREKCLALGWADIPAPASGEWKSMELPAQWQQRGLDFSGAFWFRKEVELPPEWEDRELQLSMPSWDYNCFQWRRAYHALCQRGVFCLSKTC